jgi:hypothetical protein
LSLVFREEGGLRVFEKRVLRKVFEPKGDEVTGEWRRLHNKEFNDLYFAQIYSGYQIENNEMSGTCST